MNTTNWGSDAGSDSGSTIYEPNLPSIDAIDSLGKSHVNILTGEEFHPVKLDPVKWVGSYGTIVDGSPTNLFNDGTDKFYLPLFVDANDTKGDYNGVILGTPTFDGTQATFFGAYDGVEIPYIPSVQSPMTIFITFKTDVLKEQGIYNSKLFYGGDKLRLELLANGKISSVITTTGSSFNQVLYTYTLGTTVDIAVTYSGGVNGRLSMYINGAIVGFVECTNIADVLNSNNPSSAYGDNIIIARNSYSNSTATYALEGNLSKLRVFERNSTASDIAVVHPI